MADNSTRAQKQLETQIRSSNETGDFGPPSGQSPRGIAGHDGFDEGEEIAFPGRALRSTLLQGRPWSQLLLNEGSFVRAYASYEWWLRCPPSVSSKCSLKCSHL